MGWVIFILLCMWADLSAPRQRSCGPIPDAGKPPPPWVVMWILLPISCLPMVGVFWFIFTQLT